MSKFKHWANRSGYTPPVPSRRSPLPPPQPQQPQQPPAQQGTTVLYTADGRPVTLSHTQVAPSTAQPHLVAVHRPNEISHSRQRAPRRMQHAPECSLVKDDGFNGYTQMLHQLPDLVSSGHVQDYNPEGHDALKMAGTPEGAVMADWNTSTQYYNGATDGGAANLRNYLSQQYQESSNSIRASSATVSESKQ